MSRPPLPRQPPDLAVQRVDFGQGVGELLFETCCLQCGETVLHC